MNTQSPDYPFTGRYAPEERTETRKQRRERERAEQRKNKKVAAVQNRLAKAIRNNDQKEAIAVRDRLKELRKQD